MRKGSFFCSPISSKHKGGVHEFVNVACGLDHIGELGGLRKPVKVLAASEPPL